MSDDGLDDFFAKKDKSKKKSKSSKFMPTDILDQHTEASEGGTEKNKLKKKKKKKEKDRPQQSGSADGEGNKEKEDDEWIDYEQETEKDYSGLRIQKINKDEEEGKDTGDDNEDEDGENGEKREGAQGPWNKLSQPAAPVMPEPAPQPEPEKPKEEPKTVGKYIPPSRRGMSDSTSTSSSLAQKRRSKKTAPNIQSEEDFPTLGGAAIPDCEQTDLSSFEKVRSGKRQDEGPTGGPARVEIGNKFDALSRGDGM